MSASIRLKVLSGARGHGQILLIERDRLILQEGGECWVFVDEPPEQTPSALAWFGVRQLDWDLSRRGFALTSGLIADWVGRNELTVRVGERARVVTVEVRPGANKSESADWLAMLRQLYGWLPGLVLGYEGGGLGSVDGAPSLGPTDRRTMLAAQAWIPLLPDLEGALRAIIARPHRADVAELQEVPLRAAREVTSEGVRQLVRLGYEGGAVRGAGGAHGGVQVMVPRHEARASLDHPANRRVHWLVREVIDQLDRLRARLTRAAASVGSRDQTEEWCRARADLLREYRRRLFDLLRGSFLRRLGARRDGQAPISIFVDHPAYERLQRLSRCFLAPSLRLPATPDVPPESGRAAPTRPSFDLYQLWLFWFVKECLRARLAEPEWSWSEAHLDRLFEPTETGESARFTAVRTADQARVDILCNHPFVGIEHEAYLNDDIGDGIDDTGEAAPGRALGAATRRPGLLVRARTEASGAGGESRPGAAWVCLDAAYCAPSEVERELNEMRLHRETLWLETHGGRPAAGLILAPRCPADTAWASSGYRDRYAIGVWPCPPGASVDGALAEWLLSRLGLGAR